MLKRASRGVASVLLVLTALAISDILVSPFVGGLSGISSGFGLTLKNAPAWNRFGLIAGAAAETAAHDHEHSHGNPHSGHSHVESHDEHDHEHGKATSHESDETEATSEHPYYPIFRTLLPILPTSSPLAASLAAAAVVSTAPLVLVSFLPPDIPTTALNALVAFAGGTVLGDVFLHLLPHARMEFEAAAKPTSVSSLVEEAAHAHASAFSAGAANPHAHAHGHAHGTISHEHDHHPYSLASFKVEFATLAGILAFFLLERLLNIGVKARSDAVNRKEKSAPEKKGNGEKSDNASHSHSHDSHNHDHSHSHEGTTHSKDHDHSPTKQHHHHNSSPVTFLSSLPPTLLLHILSLFSHSFLDSLALTLSFLSASSSAHSSQASTLSSGLATSLALLAHELPHRLGDRAVLLKHGASPALARRIEAIGGLGGYAWGWIVGTALVHLGSASGTHDQPGILALARPFAAGAMLYMSLVGIIGGLVGHGHSHDHGDVGHDHGHHGHSHDDVGAGVLAFLSPILEGLALVAGIAVMAYVAVNELH